MMLPIVGYGIGWKDLWRGLCFRSPKGASGLEGELRRLVGSKHVFFVNSGTAACYLLLLAMKTGSDRRDVVIPAYTASCLVNAITRAGLNPVLCDMEKDGFNMDPTSLSVIVTERTLAVLCVHLFGFPVKGLKSLREKLPQDVFLIEDCAQAMGSESGGRAAGSFSDAAFLSFNRGKNLPLYGGGCIMTDNDVLAQEIDGRLREFQPAGLLGGLTAFFKAVCLKCAFHPFFYGILYGFLAEQKAGVEGARPEFPVARLGRFQREFGSSLMRSFRASCERRFNNGQALMEGLKDCPSVILPKISDDEKPAWNRFPVLFKDPAVRARVTEALLKNHIETSEFYHKPIHHIFDLGYDRDACPYAASLSERLLTLPVHPLVGKKDLEVMIKVIKECHGAV